VTANKPIDVLLSLNYYAPYVSGLTDAARLVAEELAARGYRVVVVCSRHDRALAKRELIAGVEIRRTGVWFRIGKGVVSPFLPILTARLARRAKVLNLHLPMIESGLIAVFTPGVGKVLTYQCDIQLDPGPFNRFQQSVMDASCRLAVAVSDSTVASSLDYAEHSRLYRTMNRHHLTAIAPPTLDRSGGSATFRDGPGLHIGFLGRLVEEKGIRYLMQGFSVIDDPDARLLIAGDFAQIAGGSVINELRGYVEADPRIKVLGFLPEDALKDFYASLDVFALPSVNPLEAFGIVQVEALRVGIPVISTDMPGVRMPVLATGFGVIVPPRDAPAITAAIIALQSRLPLSPEGSQIARGQYSLRSTADDYIAVFVSASHGRLAPVE
jgi:glycosyltransferase involved in cell wall biosynthesis